MNDPIIFDHPVLTDVYKLCTEIEEAEARLRLAKQQLHEAVAALPAQIGDNEELRDAIVHHLYWLDERIPANTLKKVFGVVAPSNAGKHAKNVLRSAFIEITCYRCRQVREAEVKSKSARPYLCGECEARQNQQNESDWQQQKQAEAQRARRLIELQTMPYRDYLQTAEWQERRKRAMKRAGFRCQVCNAYGVRLNVHHRTYERRGNEQDRDLLTLCEGCHTIFHDNGKLATGEVE